MSIPRLARALRENGVNVSLVAREGPEITDHRLAALSYYTALVRAAHVSGATIVHDNGYWLPSNVVAAMVASRIGAPLIIAPRGMLLENAMARHGARKRVAWAFFGKKSFHHAAVLHATSLAEACALRKLGAGQPIAVLPNGVDLPDLALDEETLPARTITFLGRLHPHKGVDVLLDAWAKVRRPGWTVRLIGDGAKAFVAQLKEQALALKISESVEFLGELFEERKQAALRQTAIVVAPSMSENFGNSIAEAFAASRPVVTTDQTPWSDIRELQCGWIARAGDAVSLAEQLEAAMQKSSEELAQMGRRGRELVATRHSWASVGRDTSEVYSWMLRGGKVPGCIVQAGEQPLKV